jgi:hypothetical protein
MIAPPGVDGAFSLLESWPTTNGGMFAFLAERNGLVNTPRVEKSLVVCSWPTHIQAFLQLLFQISKILGSLIEAPRAVFIPFIQGRTWR